MILYHVYVRHKNVAEKSNLDGCYRFVVGSKESMDRGAKTCTMHITRPYMIQKTDTFYNHTNYNRTRRLHSWDILFFLVPTSVIIVYGSHSSRRVQAINRSSRSDSAPADAASQSSVRIVPSPALAIPVSGQVGSVPVRSGAG